MSYLVVAMLCTTYQAARAMSMRLLHEFPAINLSASLQAACGTVEDYMVECVTDTDKIDRHRYRPEAVSEMQPRHNKS